MITVPDWCWHEEVAGGKHFLDGIFDRFLEVELGISLVISLVQVEGVPETPDMLLQGRGAQVCLACLTYQAAPIASSIYQPDDFLPPTSVPSEVAL